MWFTRQFIQGKKKEKKTISYSKIYLGLDYSLFPVSIGVFSLAENTSHVLNYLITKKRFTTSSPRSMCCRQLFPLSTTMRTGYNMQPVIYIQNQKEKGVRLSRNTQLSRFSLNILIKTEIAGTQHFRSITFSQLVFVCDHMAWCVVTGLLCRKIYMKARPHASYRLSFFYHGISFSYLIQTRNFTDGTRVGETKIHLIF